MISSTGKVTISGFITEEGDGTEETPKVPKYTLTYNANGGSGEVPTSAEYEENTEVTISFPTITKEGYKFFGWATTAEATEATYITEGSALTITENVTLYAVWKKEKQTFASQITVNNYGDYVDLETNLIVKDKIALEDGKVPTTDWRIFHEDEDGGIYLILADYLPFSYETTVGSGLTQYSTSYTYNWTSKTSRKVLITRLANTGTWRNLIDSTYTAKGISVTGALDLETWVESWNTKGYTTLYKAKKTGMSDSLDGYYVGTRESPESSSIGLSSTTNTGYGDTLYFPHKNYTSRSKAYGYWLASPSAHGADYVMRVYYSGGVLCHSYIGSNSCGVRPAVYLPAGITAAQDATTKVWTIK